MSNYTDGRFSTQPTSDDFSVYASVAAGATATGDGTFGVTRAIRCDAAGTLVVKRAKDGVNVALPFAAGETQPVQATGIVSSGSSGCAPITVYR
jgi:hypothetical protein